MIKSPTHWTAKTRWFCNIVYKPHGLVLIVKFWTELFDAITSRPYANDNDPIWEGTE